MTNVMQTNSQLGTVARAWLVLACVGATAAAQTPPASSGTATLVEVVGCLNGSTDGVWTVTEATEPVVTKSPATSAAALEEAGRRPLGTRRYRLLGVGPFDPASRAGRKVAVKGVLVTAPNETRLNVTSLQSVAGSCTR
jgi:hypothetical protein